ncbi:MAG: hypothetical protein M5U28_39040 [Sandaracinaceae bacterium]|nr:hypothetical protein [Sandaracinaceae bacterium]
MRVDSAPWRLGGTGRPRNWRSAVVGLSERVELRHLPTAPVDHAGDDAIPVSRAGTLAVAEVTVRATGQKLLLASMYGAWEAPRFAGPRPWIYADASVHRVISDLSLISSQNGHRILAGGDLNVLRGYGEHGSAYWAARYATVFDRMEALGLPCVGPDLPDGIDLGACASAERPATSRTVPTFRTRASDPTSATRQLDFIFASRRLASSLTVRACSALDAWGPSDHCRIEIDVSV